MPQIPDLTDPRYLYEVGWFLYHEKYGGGRSANSFDEERLAFSLTLLDEVLGMLRQNQEWLKDKAVVSIGCGCTGDLSAWPAAVKIGIDPLLYAYQKLGMLVEDVSGTPQTMYLAVDAENLPLLDDCAELVLCRNALDHMSDPEEALTQIWRILKEDGVLFLGVDIGGPSTPDEPTVFSEESLLALLGERFDVLAQTKNQLPYSPHRVHSVRILARKRYRVSPSLDKETILQAYIARGRQEGWIAP